MKESFLRGSVWWADIPSYAGSVQMVRRPVVIISNDYGNRYSTTVICVPLTNKKKKPLPTHYVVECGPLEGSTVLCEQVFTLDKQNFLQRITDFPLWSVMEIERCLRISVGLVD